MIELKDIVSILAILIPIIVSFVVFWIKVDKRLDKLADELIHKSSEWNNKHAMHEESLTKLENIIDKLAETIVELNKTVSLIKYHIEQTDKVKI